MQCPEPVSYGHQLDCGSRLAISCLSTSFNLFSPQKVNISAAHRSTPNALRIDFNSNYQSFRDSPSKATHTYTFSPMKAEHGRTSSTSTEGTFLLSTSLKKMSDIMHARHEQYYRTFHGFHPTFGSITQLHWSIPTANTFDYETYTQYPWLRYGRQYAIMVVRQRQPHASLTVFTRSWALGSS